MPPESATGICMSGRDDFWNQSFTKQGKSEPAAALWSLTEEFGKIGHMQQKCALSLEKPELNGGMILWVFSSL